MSDRPMRLRLSVSDLDQLRYYENAENMQVEDLLARLRREEGPTRAMEAGTAFHSILEHPPSENLETVHRDGFTFVFEVNAEYSPPHIKELKGTKVYLIDGVEVTLVGKVDAMEGKAIWDHKLTGNFNVEAYTDALQWRCYLEIFESNVFHYNVFQGRENRDGEHIIREHYPMTFFRYPDLGADVVRGLEQFVEFCRFFMPDKLEK